MEGEKGHDGPAPAGVTKSLKGESKLGATGFTRFSFVRVL